MPSLAAQFLHAIRQHDFVRPGERVAVAVSGGADSVALLFLLLEVRSELGIVLSVAHVNHKLRGHESDEDERWVADLAAQHGIELHLHQAPVDAAASGIEAAARRLRYQFFRDLAGSGRATKIATGHTLDDQAETLLLRLFRGTGVRGLAGIHPRITLHPDGRVLGQGAGEVVRPLLRFRRADLRQFLRQRGQAWREDASNLDLHFLRNRVRHRLLPLIAEDFGEPAIEHLGELAEIARAEEEHWQTGHPEAALPPAPRVANSKPNDPLPLAALLALPLAAQRRLVRAWVAADSALPAISFRCVEDVLELARGPAGRKIEVPGGRFLRRTQESLLCEATAAQLGVTGYEYSLPVPGRVAIGELGLQLEALLLKAQDFSLAEPGSLLDARRLPGPLTVRNWQAGDRYWPAHTAAPKKVKELLTGLHPTGANKKLWPVAVAAGVGIVWIYGFPVPAALQAPGDAAQAIWIRHTPAMM